MKSRIIFCIGLIAILLIPFFSVTIGQNQFEILVYAQYDQYHKDNIPVGILVFKEMAQKHQFGLTWTMDAGIFTEESMKDYATIVFFNTKADQFTDEQKQGLKNYINNGGGFVGIHAATTTDGQWPWYNQLIGRVFTWHPQIQSGILEVIDPEFPATLHLPKKWIWTDEWYNFSEPKSDNLKVILKVDESTYNTTLGLGEPISVMGDFHPIAWYQEFDGGRSFYSALGHNPETYEDERHLELIYGGIYWTATGKGNMKNP